MNRLVEFSIELAVWFAIGSLIATATYWSNMFTVYSVDALKVEEVTNRFTRCILNVYCLRDLHIAFNLNSEFLISISNGSIDVNYRNYTRTISSPAPIASMVLIGGRSYLVYFNGKAVAFKVML